MLVRNLLVGVLLGSVLLSSVSRAAEPVSGPEGAVAKIGDTLINEKAVQEAVARYVPPGAFHSSLTPEQREKYRGDVLNELIEIELFHREAIRRKIHIASETIDKIIDDNIKNYGTKKRLLETLEQNKMTLEQLRARIEKIQMIKKLLQELTSESEPLTAEIADYYEKNKRKFVRPESVRFYHIMIKVDPVAPEAEWKKRQAYAEGLLKEIRDGRDFGELAYEKSEDSYRFKSGDVGFLHRGQFEIKDIEDSAFSLKVGELSSVLRSIHGFHILKAGEKKPEQALSLEEASDSIKKDMLTKKFELKRKAVLEQIKKEFPVTYYDTPKEAGSSPVVPSLK